MILVIDIGNTSTMTGLYKSGDIIAFFKMSSKNEQNLSLIKDDQVIAAKIKNFTTSNQIKPEQLDGIAICSVVPDLTDVYCDLAKKHFGREAWILDHTVDLGLKVAVDQPAQAGADRLANAVAARYLYGYPAIVVDLGTSTNFDVVNQHGDYIGGAIAPGVKTSSLELFRRASRLFPVEIEKPLKAIGRNTEDAMKSGIFYGSLGLIDHVLSLIIAELNHPDIKIIATGGYAERFASESKYIQCVDMTLTLKGIGLVFEKSVK
jgi:type III pantothenate kinase